MAVQTNGALLANRYRVIRRLGSGGAATVFLCEDQRLGRKVAVKRVHADSPEEMARRLHREARLGASLNHRGLVSVFDTVTYEEGVLIVMEYVDGETLADALRRGPLPVKRALEVIRELAAALDHAHAHGVVHRDVKPANVLLARDGAVKLVDLGIGIATGHTQITRSGVVLGTPAYMAPEQVEGSRVTAAADVYALGAVAYELLSGRKARTGRTPIEVAHKAATEPPPDLRDAWPDAPPGAAVALKRAMAREPSERQASAGELAEELSAAITGGPATASTRLLAEPTGPARGAGLVAGAVPPAGVIQGGRRGGGVPRWLPLLALLAVVAAAGLAIALGGGNGSSSQKQVAAEDRRAHHRHASKPKREATSTPAPTAPQTQSSTPPTTQSPIALNNEGKSLIDSGRPQDAIPVLQQALAAFPADQRSSLDYAYTLFNLADAYLRSGQPEKAIPLLQERLKYNDQRDVVAAELQEAMRQAGESGPGGKGKGKDKGRNKQD